MANTWVPIPDLGGGAPEGTAVKSTAVLANYVLTAVGDGTCTWAVGGGGVAWGGITGTLSAQTDLNTALGLKAPLASPTFTGVITSPLGSNSAPAICATGDATTGFFFSSAATPAITTSGTKNTEWNGNGHILKNVNGSGVHQIGFRGSEGCTEARFTNPEQGDAFLSLASGSKGWTIYSKDAAGFSNKWRFSRIDGNYYGGWFGETGSVYWGGNTTGQKGVSVTLQGQGNITNVGGTTTVNASTTVTGSSTFFLERIGIGDQISVSSASSTYAYVTAIASNTSLTTDVVLGDGTSQTINVKRAILRIDDNTPTQVGLIDNAGKWTIGKSGTTERLAFNGATEATAAGAATLLNAPAGAAGNPDIWIKIEYNGTVYVIPAWTP